MINFTEKALQHKPLYDIFTEVPWHYDLINHVITWGFDKQWRRQVAKACLASRPEKVLDLCCGTGDLAINISRLADSKVEIIAIDYSQPMLVIATRKAELLPKGKGISFIYGDAVDLPFPDGFFNCVGISFAFRNLTYKNPFAQRYIAEVLRVLKSGGRFVIVETSQPEVKLIRKLFHLYLRWFVFRVGCLLSRNRQAYRYLAESAARFYIPDEVKDLLVTAGFSQVSYCPLFLGAVSIYAAVK